MYSDSSTGTRPNAHFSFRDLELRSIQGLPIRFWPAVHIRAQGKQDLRFVPDNFHSRGYIRVWSKAVMASTAAVFLACSGDQDDDDILALITGGSARKSLRSCIERVL